jgi:hypothetical protein
VQRRNLLRAAVAGVPLLAAPALDITGAQASPKKFDQHSPRFALAVLPDTQYLFDAGRRSSGSTAACPTACSPATTT